MTPLKLVVIGSGHLGRLHGRFSQQIDGIELIGVIDPDSSASESLAKELGVASYQDVGPLLNKIDAAIVAAPTSCHYTIGRELLSEGIHVLMEKPLATTFDQANELVSLANSTGAILQIGHVERFNPAFRVAETKITSPRFIQASRTSGYTFRSTDIGVVLDLMVHDIELVLALVQAPVAHVQATGFSVMGGYEDVANAFIEFSTGCVASLSASRVSQTCERNMQVWDDHHCASLDFATRTATLTRRGSLLMQPGVDIRNLPMERKLHLKEQLFEELLPTEEILPPACNPLAEQISEFVQSIQNHGNPRVHGPQGRDAVALAERVLDCILVSQRIHKLPLGRAA